MADPVERTAARVLAMDPAHRLLLLRGHDPARPDRGSFWLVPGGGLEPGETPLDAARRELAEETGMVAERLDGPVHERVAEFDFEGLAYRQTETFYVARVAGGDIDTGGFTDVEQRAVLGHRWWTAAELRATSDVVYPAGLADLVDACAEGVPC